MSGFLAHTQISPGEEAQSAARSGEQQAWGEKRVMASFEKRYVRFMAKAKLAAKIAIQKVLLKRLRQKVSVHTPTSSDGVRSPAK